MSLRFWTWWINLLQLIMVSTVLHLLSPSCFVTFPDYTKQMQFVFFVFRPLSLLHEPSCVLHQVDTATWEPVARRTRGRTRLGNTIGVALMMFVSNMKTLQQPVIHEPTLCSLSQTTFPWCNQRCVKGQSLSYDYCDHQGVQGLELGGARHVLLARQLSQSQASTDWQV